MAYYFGIDFGTTNSAVVAIEAMDGGKTRGGQNIGEDERHPLPSFVAINKKTGEIKTGLLAKKSIADSDEFLSRENDPRLDPRFIAQIRDYDRLKDIREHLVQDYRAPRFSDAQEQILKIGLRCFYAENDPCWGYVEKYNGVVSACIKGTCSMIRQCNPRYSPAEASYWNTSAAKQSEYKDPRKLRMYYIVGMISNEEKI